LAGKKNRLEENEEKKDLERVKSTDTHGLICENGREKLNEYSKLKINLINFFFLVFRKKKFGILFLKLKNAF